MQTSKVGPFQVTTDIHGFTISRETSSLKMRPGEEASAVNIIQHAISLSDWIVLPEIISHSPMRVRFTPERLMYLGNKAEDRGEVCFKFEEGDELIEAIKSGVNKFKDIHTLKGGGPKGSFFGGNVPDPVVSGRD